MKYHIELSTDIQRMQERPYWNDVDKCWTSEYVEASLMSKEEAEETCKRINDWFENEDERMQSFYYSNTEAVVCEQYEDDEDEE